jgi:hypothetical protein
MVAHEYEEINLVIPPEFRRYLSENWDEVKVIQYRGVIK